MAPSARTSGLRRSNRIIGNQGKGGTGNLENDSQVTSKASAGVSKPPPEPSNISSGTSKNLFVLRKVTVRLERLSPLQILAATGKNPEKKSDEDAEKKSSVEASPKASAEPVDEDEATSHEVIVEDVSAEAQNGEATPSGSGASNNNENRTEGSRKVSKDDFTIDAFFDYLRPRAAKYAPSARLLLSDILQRDNVFLILMERRREILSNNYLLKNHSKEELFQMMLKNLEALVQGELRQITCAYEEVLNLFD